MDRAGHDAVFEGHRPLLFSIAYRMLGSVMEAEDAVQEAYLRWERAEGSGVRSPRSYLSTVVARLCVDQLRSARARRERYVGPWLPEPLLSEGSPGGGLAAVESDRVDDTLSMAFLVLLESLSPVERAVFLMREVFGYGYAEISAVVGKSEANCRQISHRARAAVAARRPRFDSSPEQEERLTKSFLAASANGDTEALLSLLAEDVTLYSDGGGKALAARNPIHGPANVARFLFGIIGKAPPGFSVRRVTVNGHPGLVAYFGDGRPQSVVSLEVSEGRIRAIRIVVNPDKLRALSPLSRGEA